MSQSALNSSAFAEITGVSRETLADYERWHELLVRWNARINLVSRRDLDGFWVRHALDSWQVTQFLPSNSEDAGSNNRDKRPKIIDFGSGGGFPAIALAIGCKHMGRGHVTMIESVGKKASFLKTVIRELDLPAQALALRIEAVEPQAADVITARAFAPLDRLLSYGARHQHDRTLYILPKGEAVDGELEKARRTWTFDVETAKSMTDDMAAILKLTRIRAKQAG